MEMKEKRIEESNERFDSAVREAFADYEPTVPHGLWNRIASELNTEEEVAPATHIPHHHEQSFFGKWKMAIAAAMILTVGVGSLLYTQRTNDINTPAMPVANTTTVPIATTPVVNTPVTTSPVAVNDNKVSQPAAKVAAEPVTNIKEEPKLTATNTTTIEQPKQEVKQQDVAPKQEATADVPLEFTPTLSETKPVEVGNIPVYSLNILSANKSLNDEITVIKSNDKKKKHGKKDEESTKVIIFGKKYERQPDIKYQVPIRF
jgi:hypothetical protein